MPSDVAAQIYPDGVGYTGHVAIVSKDGHTIGTSATGTESVQETTWGFRENQEGKVVFRRWEGVE